MAVMSSTAMAVEVKRCSARSFNLVERVSRSMHRAYRNTSSAMRAYGNPSEGYYIVTHRLLACSGVSNSFHKSALPNLPSLASLNKQYPSAVSYSTNMTTQKKSLEE